MSASQLRFVLVLLICSATLCGQDAAALSGTVVDPSNAVVPDAEVTLLDVQRGAVRQARTNVAGIYLFTSLPPGEYTLEVLKSGFNQLKLERLYLRVRDRKSLQLELQLAPVEPTVITVTAGEQGISSDPSTGAAVEHDYAENLPLNSRDVRSLVAMSPGVTCAPIQTTTPWTASAPTSASEEEADSRVAEVREALLEEEEAAVLEEAWAAADQAWFPSMPFMKFAFRPRRLLRNSAARLAPRSP